MISRSIRWFLAVVFATAALFVGMAALPEVGQFGQQSGLTEFRISEFRISEFRISEFGISEFGMANFGIPKVVAQRMREEDVWQQVYDRLPDLPRENQYINRQTGQANPSNTLVTRLIRYHVYVKQRPANYRLDWKLTLADYLGANERINEATYPGADTLRTSPLEGDRAAIQKLDRVQRNALVQALVDIFTPATATTSAPPATPTPNSTPTPIAPPAPSAPVVPTQPREPRPGDAQLLLQ